MSGHKDPITTKRIGYLRMARPSTADPRPSPSAPITSMWRKLAAIGLIESTEEGTFRRTPEGDKVLGQFDNDLPAAIRRVLNAVKMQVSGAAAMKGMVAAINAGLVLVLDAKPHYVLTDAGKGLADPIGEEGYFQKSGNLVRVISACWDFGMENLLEVERVDGESRGKRMMIPRGSFVGKATWEAMSA